VVGVCIAVIGDALTMAQPAFLAILFWQNAEFLRETLGQPPKMRMISR
jgi:hypothetical protein